MWLVHCYCPAVTISPKEPVLCSCRLRGRLTACHGEEMAVLTRDLLAGSEILQWAHKGAGVSPGFGGFSPPVVSAVSCCHYAPPSLWQVVTCSKFRFFYFEKLSIEVRVLPRTGGMTQPVSKWLSPSMRI